VSTLRTANLLGALGLAVADRLAERARRHPAETDTSAAALALVAAVDGCSIRELSGALKLSHSAAVRLVARLQSQGLATAGPGRDRRSAALSLTPAGRDRAASVLRDRAEALGGMVGLLSAEQRACLDGIAETLLRAFTGSPLDAAHICRLCDPAACPEERCPVHVRALEHLAAERPDPGGG
jgi:DNA-binding MarR family transcriptional regulator